MSCLIERRVIENLRRLIREKGLTQVELAHQLSLSPQAINQYLNGRRSISLSLLDSLSFALKVEPSRLLESGLALDYSKDEMLGIIEDSFCRARNKKIFNSLTVLSEEEFLRQVELMGGWDVLARKIILDSQSGDKAANAFEKIRSELQSGVKNIKEFA